VRKKGEPRDPIHSRKNTKLSQASRNASAREAGMNSTMEPPNRAGRTLYKAAQRTKAKAKAEAEKADA